MLNVLYKENKEQYLNICLEKHKQFNLNTSEKDFIKNVLSLIAYYIGFVMVEEECNIHTLAKILNLLKQDKNNNSVFFYLIEDAIRNEDKTLTTFQTCVLENYLNKVKPLYQKEYLTLFLQVVLADYMLNPESNCRVHNLINIALLKLNMPYTSESEELFNALCEMNTNDKNIYAEFSPHYENLMMSYENKHHIDRQCLDFIYKKYYRIPEQITKKLTNQNVSFCLTNIQLNKDSHSLTFGSTHIGIEKIRVWFENDIKAVDVAFYHEIGHVYDYLCGFFSRDNKDWEEAYNKEKMLFLKYKKKQQPKFEKIWLNAISNKTEYFAEVFSEYIKDKDELKKFCPLTFQTIDKLINA